jgi:hypothetical protein
MLFIVACCHLNTYPSGRSKRAVKPFLGATSDVRTPAKPGAQSAACSVLRPTMESLELVASANQSPNRRTGSWIEWTRRRDPMHETRGSGKKLNIVNSGQPRQ